MRKRVVLVGGSHAPPGGRRWFVALVTAAVFVYLFGTTVYVQSQSVYLGVHMNGNLLGYVAGQQTVDEAVALAEAEAARGYGFPVRFADPPSTKEVITHERYSTLSVEALADKLRQAGRFRAHATILVIDGQPVAALPSREAAESVLHQLKQRYARQVESSVSSGQLRVEEVTLREPVSLVARDDVPADQVRDAVEVLALLTGDRVQAKVHVVQAGESPWSIASANGVTVDQLLTANPGIDAKRLQPGQTLRLTVPQPWVTFRSRERWTVVERIPFATRRHYDSSLHAGKQVVRQEGQYGEKVITYSLVRQEGRIVSQEKVAEEVTKEPVEQVVVVGTKPVAGVSSGRLQWPLRGRITSPYGPRWGDWHTGIDIDGTTGQPVRAADGGTVVSAGWDGAYGRAVQIRHSGGVYTFYAHLSRISVSVGEQVAQGETIGYVGSTGHSTGSHLHFEVRRCASPHCAVSPMGHLP